MFQCGVRGAVLVFLVILCAKPFAQPSDWVVTPSAYEFSMTVTFTVSIDGLVGANPNHVAAVFDDEGLCRGLGPTDFNAASGYFTGLMLVYSNQTTEAGLEVRIWDATLDSLPGCNDQLEFIANGIAGSLANPIVFYGVYDPLVGCTDLNACNYLATALTDNGSCIYPGCDDISACNYVDASPCYDNASCTYPEDFLDCEGACLSDFDGDGICDEFEIGGCTDDRACNYNPDATDEDCSCEFPFYPLDCDGNCYLDTDGDGICEADEIPGCDDPLGCNFDPVATDNDGSCEYCCYSLYNTTAGFGLDIESHAGPGSDNPGLAGLTTYRIYVTCPSPLDRVMSVTGSGGNSTFVGSNSGFYQNQQGALLITDIDSALFANDAEVALDSWLTIGHDTPAANSTLEATFGIWSTLFEFGEDLFIGGVSEDGWSIAPSDDVGLAGEDLRVLIGQFSSATPIEGSLNVTVLPADGSGPISFSPLFVAPPCGCTDESACNFDSGATFDNGSCAFPEAETDCNGQCQNDADGDGVCDEDEVAGCTDFNAVNFDPNATDASEDCLFAGCTYPEASNFNPGTNLDDGSCQFELSNPCPTDIDGDGITAASDILTILAQYGVPCQ